MPEDLRGRRNVPLREDVDMEDSDDSRFGIFASVIVLRNFRRGMEYF